MENNSTFNFRKYTLLQFALAVFILMPTFGFGQIVAWQFAAATGNESTYNATTNNVNLNTSILSRGSGIGINPVANGFTSDKWVTFNTSESKAIGDKEYFEFSIQSKAGFCTSLSTLNAKIRRSEKGPENYSWKYSIDGVTFNDIIETTVTNQDTGKVQNEVLLSSISDLQNVGTGTIITFRIYAWGAESKDASFGFAKTTVGTTINCLAIGGTVEALTLSSSSSIVNMSKTNNSTATVAITSNTTWTAVSDQNWLKVSGDTKGNGTLTFTTAESNPTIFARTAIVTLSAADMVDRTITVTQAAGDATLSVSANTVDISKTANNTANVFITSNSTWSAASNQDWLSVTSGATGNALLTFTSTANPLITTRLAIVTIKATGVADKTITVTQAAGDATLAISANTVDISKTANSTANVSIASNSTWITTSDQDWLTVTSGATGNGTLIFTAKYTNPEITTRSAIVTIQAANLPNQTVTVTQAAGDATLSVSSTLATVAKTVGSTANITVLSNSPWTATTDQGWLNVTSGATGNGVLTFTAKYTNTEIITRSATVTIKANGTDNQIVTVTQVAGDATLSIGTSTATVLKTAGSTANISVISNSTWTATSDQDWLTLTPETTGNGTLTITTKTANPLITNRFATVTIKATGAEYKTITVTQAAGDAAFSVLANTADIDANANNSASINVNSNILWTATSNASWLTIGSISTGSGILTVSATNTLEATRQATVTISAQGFPSKTVTVTQAWGANTNKFQLNMTVTAVASINDKEIVNSNFLIAAFIGDECRGVAKLQYVSALKQYMAFMMVWGNKDDMNKNVTFKSLNQLNNIQLPATNTTLAFMPESRTGSPANPYAVNFVQDEASYGSIMVTPGGLSKAIKNAGLDITTLTSLKLLGSIDARDFKTMRDSIPLLADLNMSGVTIKGYTGLLGPSGASNYEYPENEIASNAFSYNYKGKVTLKNVIMPLSAKSIGGAAFEYCIGLTSITIPSSVTTIKFGAFANCTGLTTVTIPATINSIGNSAFSGNKCYITVDANNAAYSSIDGVLFDKNKSTLIFCPTSKTGTYNIPTTVTTIKPYAFRNCIAITGLLAIPTSVTTIEACAFLGCTGLTSVVLPTSVTTLADFVFSQCSELISVTLPPTLTTIGAYAFFRCFKLTTFSIPASVTLIKTSAFNLCVKLKSIISYSTLPPSLETDALDIDKPTCSLDVPAGSLAAYKAALQWKDFIIQGGIITITLPTPLNSFSSASGAASDIQTFKVDASVKNNLVITAPTGFEIREYGVAGNFGSSITFAPVAYTVDEKIIEVRISDNVAVGVISGDVVCSSTGATSKNVAVLGTVSAPSVSSVSVPTNGIYKAGDELLFTVNFNAPITVTNYPTLPLAINSSGTVNVNYVSGSGTSALLFSYTIVANDYDNDGIKVGASINANGGALKSALGVDAVLALNNVNSTANLQIDAIAPTVSISSTTSETTNTNPIPITITFSKSVTGFVLEDITVANGTAGNFSGSGTSYAATVIPTGQGTVTINVASAVAKDAVGNFNTAAAQLTRTFDSQGATVSSVTVPANGTYMKSQTLDFVVNFTKNTYVVITNGTPYITITLASGTVNASYISGSGTSALLFRYTIALGNSDNNGIALGASITANGGTIKDIFGNNTVLTLNNVGNVSSVLVDGIAPTVLSVSSSKSNGTYKSGDLIPITINFSEAVNVTGTPTLALNSGGIANYASGTGTSALIFNYTVGDAQSTGDLNYSTINSLNFNTGTISDLPGNTATLTLPLVSGAGSLGTNKSIVIGILPSVTTQTATLITATTATVASTISNLGYPNPTQYGVVWSTATSPTTALTTKTTQGAIAAAGSFTSTMTGLTASGKYYVRAYATNGAGTYYGNEVILNMPTITKTATLVAFTSCKNTISTEQSFSVSGNNLITDISISAPSGFEICKTSDGTYSNSLSLTQTDGNINAATVFVRLATTATGNPEGYIYFSSTGASTQTQYVSGTLTTPQPPLFTLMVNPSSGAVCSGNAVTLTAKEKNSLAFDGEDDYVDLGDINELNNVTQFSIEAMVYSTESSEYKTIFSKREEHNNKIQLFFNNKKGLTFAIGNGNLIKASMTSALTLNTWVHVVAVYNSSASSNEEKIKLYLNGVAATLSFSGTFPTSTSTSTSPALLGSEEVNPSTNVCFTGKMYDFRIWSTARTGAEVLASVNQSVSNTSSGLVSEYKLDGVGTSLTAYNSAGSNYNGTLNNFDATNPWSTSSTPVEYSWSDSISNGIPFIPTKSGIYTVTASSTTGNCPISVSSSVSITVNPLPIPIITGSATACINSTKNTYSTEVGMTGYEWTISSGGTITAGQGTNTIVVKWNTVGDQNIAVNYTNTNNCTATESTSYLVKVFALPTPSIIGNTTVCLNSIGTYSTEVDMKDYNWSISSGGTITSGAGTNTITVAWTNAGAQSVLVNYANANNCQADTATIYKINVLTLPVPTITGAALACINTTENIYSTEAGMTGYAWAISSGGTITSGAGTNSITVKWNVLGNQSISVNYANANNCKASIASIYPIVVNALPTPTITGNAVACMLSADNYYTTEIGKTGYIWTVSSGGTITAGGGTSDNTCTVTWTTAGANTVSVNYYNSNGCMAATAKVYNVTVNPLPASPAFNLKVEPASGTVCAGNPVTLTVLKNTDLTFDGTNDYIDLGNITELNNTSKFTLEAMVYCTQNNDYRTFFSKRDSHTSKIQLLFNNNAKLTFAVGNNDLMEAAMQNAFPLNTWVHVVAAYNATAIDNQGKMKIYINGVEATLIYSGTVPSTTATIAASALIGSESSAYDTRLYYSGKMNDFRIWNTARSTAQILSSYNQCLSDSKSGLIAEYKLDGLVGTSIANNSAGTNYNGNLNNFDLATVWNLSTVGCGNNPSYSWSDGISNGVPFTPTKSGNYTVTATRSNGTCSITESTTVAITVNPLPIPTINGKASVCINSTSNVYSTESGMSGYTWSISSGGTITAGGGSNDNTVTVTWTTLGNKTISVNYMNANGCTANAATNYNVKVEMPTISTSTTSVNVDATDNNSSTVDITSNTTWTATSSDSNWLNVNNGATGNGTITFTATANPYITTRFTTVTVKAAGATDITIYVTQDAGNSTLSVSETKANVAKTANSTAQINVISNSTWTATSNQNWLSVSDGNTGNGILIFTTTAANETITTRSATVTIKATGATDQTVIVTQAAGDAYLLLSATKVNIDVNANNSATVDISSNTTWTATTNENWLTISDGAQGNGSLTFTATNTNEANREALVTVKGIGVEDQYVIVSQKWGVNSLKYPINMSITGKVFIDDNEIYNSNLQLAVFIDDECRGIGSLEYNEDYKRYMVQITVWGNYEDLSKKISFKGLDLKNNKELSATNAMLEFNPEVIIGTDENPYSIFFVQKVTDQSLVNEQNVRIYPNPVKNVLHIDCQSGDIQELYLTDAMGRTIIEINKLIKNYVNTSQLVKGIYMLRIKNNDKTSIHKIIKQ
jgi:hypothetical protein